MKSSGRCHLMPRDGEVRPPLPGRGCRPAASGSGSAGAASNLWLMPKLTAQDRADIVAAYRSSRLTQEEFCAQYTGISPRTLRSWARAARRPPEALARARSIINSAVEELQALLNVMDAQADDLAADIQGDVIDVGEAAAGVCRAAVEEAPLADGETPPPQLSPPTPAQARLAMPPAHTWMA